MQPISRQLQSSPSNPQTVSRDTFCCSCSSYKSRTADGRIVSTVPASPVAYPGNKTRGCTLSDYRVCKFTQAAIQAGNSLMRSVAGFAFQQVMDSPEIGLVCPGLKESLVFLSALPMLVTGNQTCPDGEVLCDSGEKCIPESGKCHSVTTASTPQASPSDSRTGGTSSSDRFLRAAPFFGGLAGICCASAATYYCIAVYRSVKAMRCSNPEASTCQLIQMALKQPHYFRYPHQPVPIDVHQDDIVRPASPGRPGQRSEAQLAVHPQAMHLPTYQQATELPNYQQATELPNYQQTMELPNYQQATELPTYQQATRGRLPTYVEAIAETWV
ncbi:hypothetical protein [Endozoicomonas sp. YOMI1]|uniref:hypothetical protein n=1 Tax=Endozoicomonas sp. YOMI1 TaxID=2828739 RepID=UPI0021471D87|nr:hypothetical protein [Endozoicomonas sp. YOMI1]